MLTATVFSGCGNTKTPTPSTAGTESKTQASADDKKEPVELTIWVTSRNADDFAVQQEKKFLDANPQITLNKVVKEGDPGNEFYQAVAAGTAPDLVNASFTMMDKFMTAGILEPLNEYTKNWDEFQFYDKDYVEMFSKNGNQYGLTTSVAPMLFGYNKALFKEAGIENPPKTWEEAVEIAKKINNPNKQIAGYSTLAAEWTEWFFQYYVWQAGGDLTKQNADDTITLTFADPAAVKAGEFYQKLRKEKVIQSDLTLKFTDLQTNFANGKVGMMPFATDWVTTVINAGMNPDDIGLCLPPAGPGGSQATAIAGACDAINAKTTQAKKDAAWEFIKFNHSKENIDAGYKNTASKGAISPITITRTDMSIADYAEFPAEYKQVLADVGKVGRLEFYGKADFGAYVDRAVQKVLVDPNADVKTELEAAQKLAEAEALNKFNTENKRK